MSEYSDYIVFVDESGDHNLKSVNKDYPIFVLAFCIIKCDEYINDLSPKIQKFKFDFWGHDEVILHEHDIRKQKEPYTFLRADSKVRERFFADLNEIIDKTNVEIVYTLINKKTLIKKYLSPYNPYEIALLFCMEKLLEYLLQKEQSGKTVNVIFESRGKKEDNELELEFRRICDNKTWGYKSKKYNFSDVNFNMIFSCKASNSSGLQFADLVARPIGLNYLKPEQPNRAYQIIKNKIIKWKRFPA